MKKEELLVVMKDYLSYFPNEKEREEPFLQYLFSHTDEQIVDWNNFDGHIVASGFVYAKKENKFLCLYHKDLKMYLYPGGHIDLKDRSVLEAAKREVFEETGIEDIEQFILSNNPSLPIDIDIHSIAYNERLNLPSHTHFDFRYLFIIEEIEDIQMDKEEHENYKWIELKELSKDKNFGTVVEKLKKFLKED